MAVRPKVLFVGVPESVETPLVEDLTEHGCRCERTRGIGEAVFRASWDPPSIVVVDSSDGACVAKDVIEALADEGLAVPVIGVDRRSAPDALLHLAERSDPDLAAVRGRAPRVLVVDDDEELRFLLDLELRFAGFEVEHVADGREALARLDVAPAPDAILLDLMMPRVSGIGFLAALDARRNHPPVVVYSAFVPPETGQYRHVRAVLRKPERLVRVVEELRACVT